MILSSKPNASGYIRLMEAYMRPYIRDIIKIGKNCINLSIYIVLRILYG